MSVLRDISVILLAAGAFVFTLIPLALFGGVVYAVWRLLRHGNMPTWLRTVREYLTTGLTYVEMAMDGVTRPIFVIHAAFARMEGWMRSLRRRGGG